MENYSDLFYAFIDILIHMLLGVAFKMSAYFITVKLWNFFWKEQEDQDNEKDLLFTEDDYLYEPPEQVNQANKQKSAIEAEYLKNRVINSTGQKEILNYYRNGNNISSSESYFPKNEAQETNSSDKDIIAALRDPKHNIIPNRAQVLANVLKKKKQ